MYFALGLNFGRYPFGAHMLNAINNVCCAVLLGLFCCVCLKFLARVHYNIYAISLCH